MVAYLQLAQFNLDLDIVFVDTTSTYFELDVPDELAELADTVDDDAARPVEAGTRTFGYSKEFRTDLPGGVTLADAASAIRVGRRWQDAVLLSTAACVLVLIAVAMFAA